MFKLIQLEWKKISIGKYIRNAAIMTGVLLLFVMATAAESDAAEMVDLFGKSMINVTVELFTHMSYIVFTGVMLAGFIVSAYENRTINLMFSYPIRRQKILLSKIFAVWIFCFSAMVLSKFFLYGVLYMTTSYTNLTAADISFGEVSFYSNILLSSAAMVSISYIALLVGLMMKSSKATIITSVIITCLTQGNIGEYTLANNITFYVGLLVLSVAAVYLSVHNVETKDVL